uniref:Uncharacterized protein n=1 Tax=Eptatretus burgeri TaxID=7764 RepID=A0A8C4NCV0_EPTBU
MFHQWKLLRLKVQMHSCNLNCGCILDGKLFTYFQLSSLSIETNDATTPQTEEMQHRNISYPTNRLSAQGQSDSEPGVRSSNGIRDLHRESSKTDGQAIVTAALAAAFCNLVGNIMAIAPDETTAALESYGVFGALVRWKSLHCFSLLIQSIYLHEFACNYEFFLLIENNSLFKYKLEAHGGVNPCTKKDEVSIDAKGQRGPGGYWADIQP